MSRISLEPDQNGSGVFTIASPNSNTSRTLTLPDAAGTVSVADSNGIISANGIAFPATQSASANANTLDDYEEGTWTPTDGSGAALSLTASGWYTKIGQVVIASCTVTYPSTANGSNSQIDGLPFTTVNNISGRQGFMSYTTESTVFVPLPSNNSTNFQPRTNTGARITNATLSTDSFFATLLYFV